MNSYLERFKNLEEEVIKIEKQVIEKEDYVVYSRYRFKVLKMLQWRRVKIK
jgi:hypothetical protein